MRVAFGRHSKELKKRPVTGGIAASRSHQAVERSREFTHSLFNSCSAGCLGTRLLSRSAARDPANSVRIARGMGAPSAANPAADRTEPVQLISTKNGRVVPRGGPSKRTTTNALSCLNLPKHFPYRKRFISASSTAMRLSRSARAASTSAASKRCGMCCEQFAASLSTRRRFRLLGFAPNLDTSPVCIVHPGLLSTGRFSIAIATDQQISKTDRTQTVDTLRSLDAFS
jgi:hypothetical protein